MVKTELNWALRISALSLGESLSSPFSFRGAISIESVFLCLMKVHSLLLFELFSLSVIMDSVYDQYAFFVALCMLFLRDFSFNLRLSVLFCGVFLKRWSRAFSSFLTFGV